MARPTSSGSNIVIAANATIAIAELREMVLALCDMATVLTAQRLNRNSGGSVHETTSVELKQVLFRAESESDDPCRTLS